MEHVPNAYFHKLSSFCLLVHVNLSHLILIKPKFLPSKEDLETTSSLRPSFENHRHTHTETSIFFIFLLIFIHSIILDQSVVIKMAKNICCCLQFIVENLDNTLMSIVLLLLLLLLLGEIGEILISAFQIFMNDFFKKPPTLRWFISKSRCYVRLEWCLFLFLCNTRLFFFSFFIQIYIQITFISTVVLADGRI